LIPRVPIAPLTSPFCAKTKPKALVLAVLAQTPIPPLAQSNTDLRHYHHPIPHSLPLSSVTFHLHFRRHAPNRAPAARFPFLTQNCRPRSPDRVRAPTTPTNPSTPSHQLLPSSPTIISGGVHEAEPRQLGSPFLTQNCRPRSPDRVRPPHHAHHLTHLIPSTPDITPNHLFQWHAPN
jgi:hypothetical protein